LEYPTSVGSLIAVIVAAAAAVIFAVVVILVTGNKKTLKLLFSWSAEPCLLFMSSMQ
jgi:hypothetical protein